MFVCIMPGRKRQGGLRWLTSMRAIVASPRLACCGPIIKTASAELRRLAGSRCYATGEHGGLGGLRRECPQAGQSSLRECTLR